MRRLRLWWHRWWRDYHAKQRELGCQCSGWWTSFCLWWSDDTPIFVWWSDDNPIRVWTDDDPLCPGPHCVLRHAKRYEHHAAAIRRLKGDR